MVKLPPAPHVSQVTLNWRYLGQDCKNVLHYTAGPDREGPIASEIGPRLVPKVNAAFLGQVSPSLALMSITVTPLSPADQAPQDYTAGLPLVGTNPNTAHSGNTAIVTTFKTNLRGRSYRGRSFLPGSPVLPADPNSISSGAQVAIQAFWQSLVILSGTPDFNLVVLSYYTNKALRPVPHYEQVLTATTKLTLGTMRRRMP